MLLELEIRFADQASATMLQARLADPETGRSWDGTRVVQSLQSVLDRCTALAKHPEDRADVLLLPAPDEGEAPLPWQRPPQPDLVTTGTPSIDDIGAWLFLQLPDAIREQLTIAFDQPLRLLVKAHGDAIRLPWHRLAAPIGNAWAKPVASGKGEIWFYTEGKPIDAPLQPRVLLLVGAQTQKPGIQTPEYDVAEVVRAIRAGGFECTVASATEVLVGADQNLGPWIQLRNRAHVGELLRDGDYDIVHFVGHSDAKPAANQPMGATALEFDFPKPDERFLPVAELAAALRQRRDATGWMAVSRTRLFVVHACLTREAIASALLDPDADGVPGSVDAVLTMGAMAPPPVCAAFSRAFYRKLQTTKAVPTAIAWATRALRRMFVGYDWLPMFWSRSRQSTLLADASSQRLDAYCRSFLDRHQVLDGLFGKLPHGLDQVGRDLATMPLIQGREDRYHRIESACTARKETARFRNLILDGGWWAIGDKAGVGKTTTQLHHGRRMAKDPSHQFVPIYLWLPAWLPEVADQVRDANSGAHAWLFGHVANKAARVSAAAREQLAKDLAAHGGLVVMLDGLDELSPELQRLVLDRENGLLAKLRSLPRLFVATRRTAVAKDLPVEWFDHADLKPLDEAQAVALLKDVLSAEPPPGTKPLAKQAIERHVDWFEGELLRKRTRMWREIAEIPLLVGLLGLQLREGKEPAVPRLQFFEYSFEVLCSGSHRASAKSRLSRGEYLDALPVLQYLAWRLTLAKTAAVPLATLVEWLAPMDPAAAKDPLAAPPDVVKVVHSRSWQPARRGIWARLRSWLPGARAELKRVPARTRVEQCLRRIAEESRILAPEQVAVDGASGTAEIWRFWHRSFQAALCAMYLDRRYVAKAANAAVGASVLLREMEGWGIGGAPTNDEIRAQLEVVSARMSSLEASQEVVDDASAAPADDPIAHARELQRAIDLGHLLPNAAMVVARSRAVQQRQEPIVEALALLATRLGDGPAFWQGLLDRSWLFAWRTAMTVASFGADVALRMLERLPTLGQRAALIDHASASAAEPRAMLAAFVTRGKALQQYLVKPERPPVEEPSARAVWQRRVWDAPGELAVLVDGCRTLGRIPGLEDSASRAVGDLLDLLPTPDANQLERELSLVPGREKECETGRSAPGVRMWRHAPAGEFWMGTPPEEKFEDAAVQENVRTFERQHRVAIRQAFWISAAPVTVAVYAMFSPQHEVWCGSGVGYRRVDEVADGNVPVTSVSHHAARLFCLWLHRHAVLTQTGQVARSEDSEREPSAGWLLRHLQEQAREAGAPVPTGLEVRLPFEAEWEYAARAGSSTRFFFGDADSDLEHWGRYNQGEQAAPCAVAAFRGQPEVVQGPAEGANAWGLFDVHGNVWELCLDWHAPYPDLPAGEVRESIVGPLCGRFRVCRGGSARGSAISCRAADRNRNEPDRNDDFSGFRLVVAAAACSPNSIMDG